MSHLDKNKEFNNLVKDIVNNKTFIKVANYNHHGITRGEHSIRVAYYSFKVSKKFNFKTKEITRGAMLHDLFENSDDETLKESFKRIFTHAKTSRINAENNFSLNEIEKDIIEKHMFPLNLKLPKYKESFIVSLIDKCVASYEFCLCLKIKRIKRKKLKLMSR